MNSVRLLFFAQAAGWAGRREMNLGLEAPRSLAQLVQGEERLSALWEQRKILRVAVNHEIVDFDREVRHGDEVAFLPPYSGG